MRKFILISALILTSVSAQAGDTRSLSLAGIPTATTAKEAPKPIAQVSVQLAQAATTANDAAPVQVPAAAPVQAQAPAPAQTAAPAATTTATTATTTTTTTETKPATATETKKTAKKVRRESDEAKARRIAARYGVYW